jgi:hypothetical protein
MSNTPDDSTRPATIAELRTLGRLVAAIALTTAVAIAFLTLLTFVHN